jgi:hypothetical protein
MLKRIKSYSAELLTIFGAGSRAIFALVMIPN